MKHTMCLFYMHLRRSAGWSQGDDNMPSPWIPGHSCSVYLVQRHPRAAVEFHTRHGFLPFGQWQCPYIDIIILTVSCTHVHHCIRFSMKSTCQVRRTCKPKRHVTWSLRSSPLMFACIHATELVLSASQCIRKPVCKLCLLTYLRGSTKINNVST